MKLVVGLGNPGKRYDGTRHNVGFAVIDTLAAAPGVGKSQARFDAEVAEWFEDGEKVLLMMPQTFMNLSGRSVRQAVDFYQLEHEHVLVVCDDMSLPLGKLRFRARGTHGGHNGLRDIQSHLGTTEYSRLRIGVDSPREDKATRSITCSANSSRAKSRPSRTRSSWAVQGVVLLGETRDRQVHADQYNG